jgi:hypothetical protein
MSPGDLSRLAAGLADLSDLRPVHAAVVLTLAAATGPDGIAFISVGRLAKRVGCSRGHAFRAVAWAGSKGLITIENVSGRSNRYTFTLSASAQGGERQRAGGSAPARHVPSKPPRFKPNSRSQTAREGLRLAGTTPTQRYEQPTDGVCFAEAKKRWG